MKIYSRFENKVDRFVGQDAWVHCTYGSGYKSIWVRLLEKRTNTKSNDCYYRANSILDTNLTSNKLFFGNDMDRQWFLNHVDLFLEKSLKLIEPIEILTTRELFYNE